MNVWMRKGIEDAEQYVADDKNAGTCGGLPVRDEQRRAAGIMRALLSVIAENGDTLGNIMRVRTVMAENGWHSDDRLDDIGHGNKVGYSIWFYRWDWHGNKKRGAKVCFHQGTSDLSRMDTTVLRCAELALVAWDKYTDPMDSPYLDSKGEMQNAKWPHG